VWPVKAADLPCFEEEQQPAFGMMVHEQQQTTRRRLVAAGSLPLLAVLALALCEGVRGWVRPSLAKPKPFGARLQRRPLQQQPHHSRRPIFPSSSLSSSSSFTLASTSMTTGIETAAPTTAAANNEPLSTTSTTVPINAAAPTLYPVVTVRQGFADFRSDTVTQPTQQMRKAMSKAEVGDDVFREDPTVDQLEREVAALLGHEAALFVPSRTMGNLISIMIWCSSRGSSFICGEKSHVFLCEEGGAAQFGGVSPFPVPHNEVDGSLSVESIRKAILEETTDVSLAQLITLESPVDRCGGRVLSAGYIESVAALAHEHGLKLHLDGSRIWNAAVAAGVEVKEMTKHADSVTVCMSKGLGAPAGSLLVGSRAFTEKARKIRKALGGAMRQVGVLAAAGLVALKRTLPRLAEDHENAKRLAYGLSLLPGLKVNPAAVETNIVMVDLDERLPLSPPELLEELEKRNVLALAVGPRRLRFVTHYDVSEFDVKKALGAFEKILSPYKELFLQPLPPATAAAAAAVEAAATAQAAAAIATAAAAAAALQQQLQQEPGVIDTTATVVVNNTVAAAGTATAAAAVPVPVAATGAAAAAVEEKLVDLVVHGVSTSEQGFVVILAQKDDPPQGANEVRRQKKALKVVITPSDPMSAGLDVHQAETPEAVTLLQLLQDIDVGSYLKHDALSTLVGVRAGHPVTLNRVVLEQLSVGGGAGASNSNKRFKARLEVDVGDIEGGTPAAATAGAAAGEQQTFKDDSAAGTAAAVAAAAAGGMPLPGSAAPTRVVEAEVKSTFQAMALAFRYNAQLAAAASILEDAIVSVDLGEVRGIFPDLLELKPGGMKASPTTVASALDLDAEYEITRLEKQLQAALAAGGGVEQQAVVAKLRKRLALYAPDLQELAGGGGMGVEDMPLLESAAPSFYAQAAQGGVQQQQQQQGQQQGQQQTYEQQQQQQQQQQWQQQQQRRNKSSVAPPFIPPPPADLIDSP